MDPDRIPDPPEWDMQAGARIQEMLESRVKAMIASMATPYARTHNLTDLLQTSGMCP